MIAGARAHAALMVTTSLAQTDTILVSACEPAEYINCTRLGQRACKTLEKTETTE